MNQRFQKGSQSSWRTWSLLETDDIQGSDLLELAKL